MAKIYEFTPREPNNVVKLLEDILSMAKAGKLENLTLAARLNDGDVMTAFANIDYAERLSLIGHLQFHITQKIVEDMLDG